MLPRHERTESWEAWVLPLALALLCWITLGNVVDF